MGKKKSKGGVLGKIASVASDFIPGGAAVKRGIKLAKGAGALLGGRKKGGGTRRAKRLTPERLVKKLIQQRMKNKLLREKMKPLSYIK